MPESASMYYPVFHHLNFVLVLKIAGSAMQ